MKKLIIIFFAFSFSAYSQQKKDIFNLLLVVGVSPAQIHGDNYSGFNKVGFMGGTGLETVFNEEVSMNLSFLFIQKGARKNQNIEKNDLTYYYLNLNYLEVPVLVTYTHKRFLFDAGVSAAYLINYVEGSEAGNYTGVFPFQKFDYSVKVGLGVNLSPKWFVNFRSSNSFITTRPNRVKQAIYYNNIVARTFNKGYYNNILEFTLGYRIKTKKNKVE